MKDLESHITILTSRADAMRDSQGPLPPPVALFPRHSHRSRDENREEALNGGMYHQTHHKQQLKRQQDVADVHGHTWPRRSSETGGLGCRDASDSFGRIRAALEGALMAASGQLNTTAPASRYGRQLPGSCWAAGGAAASSAAAHPTNGWQQQPQPQRGSSCGACSQCGAPDAAGSGTGWQIPAWGAMEEFERGGGSSVLAARGEQGPLQQQHGQQWWQQDLASGPSYSSLVSLDGVVDICTRLHGL